MNNKGFTLLELLVVVLIIGILASIALPQYQMAVTKAKVASMLPLMRRFKDALQEYKLQHGDYDFGDDTSALGVSWPSDWKLGNNPCGDNANCSNDYWNCYINDNDGHVQCEHTISEENGHYFDLFMYQPDDLSEDLRDKVTCYSDDGGEGVKVCKAVGSKAILDDGGEVEYQL